jgi:hypothetical protein
MTLVDYKLVALKKRADVYFSFVNGDITFNELMKRAINDKHLRKIRLEPLLIFMCGGNVIIARKKIKRVFALVRTTLKTKNIKNLTLNFLIGGNNPKKKYMAFKAVFLEQNINPSKIIKNKVSKGYPFIDF